MNTWHNKKLKDIVTFVSGNTPDTKNEAFWNGKIPWVSAKDLKQFHIKSSIDSLSEQGKQVASLVPANTILILVRGMMLHRDFPVCISSTELAINQDLKGLIPKEAVDPLYLAYALKKDKKTILDHVESSGHGTGKLDTSFLKELKISYPNIQLQEEITSILSVWASFIEKVEKLITEKVKQKDWIVSHILKAHQYEWKSVNLGELFSIISDKNHPIEQLLSVTQNHGVIPRTELSGRVMSPEGEVNAYKLITPGDFAVSLRSFQGGLEYSKYRGIISPAYTVLRPKANIDSLYFKYFFKSRIFIDKYLSLAVIGIRDGKQISIPDLMLTRIPLPPIVKQKKYGEILSTANREIDILNQHLIRLNAEKSFLMNKLLSGEWEPPELEKEASL